MHFVKARGILSPQNGMNLYRGCSHGCIYCDSRSLCYQMKHRFEDIEVKENALELLEQALRRKRKPCMIGTGAMSDPYIPLELELQHTRGALELIARYGFGLAIQTKSSRILRDMDLLERIQAQSKCVVQITLTTLDEEMCRKVEPGVCTTRERFAVLKTMQEAGIPTVVWLTPLLPFLNDTEENVRGLVDLCHQAGVRGILFFGPGLTLRDGNREYYYQQLDRLFPGLKERYIARYGNRYEVTSPDSVRLTSLFHRLCESCGMLHDNDRIFAYLHAFEAKQAGEQISLWGPPSF